LDGIIVCAILFSALFLSSFVRLPAAGLAELYRESLLKIGVTTVLALLVILAYAIFGVKDTLHDRVANAKGSLLASLSVLLLWAVVWMIFGELSGMYHLVSEEKRIGLVPLALCVGMLNGLVVYAHCTRRFVSGVGPTVGILVSSLVGWVLFVAASVDFALCLFPVLVMLAYVTVKTGSPLGPIVATGLLLAFFYVYFPAPVWVLGSRQTGYWLMMTVTAAVASVAGLSLMKIPLGGHHFANESSI
jgi:hypothetical protein